MKNYLKLSEDGKTVVGVTDEEITECVIPDGVTTIGDCAFQSCASLKKVTIPSSVTKIEGEAFSWCDSLEEITIPEGVKEIPDYAFIGCGSLKKLTVPEGVTRIGDQAFEKCFSLEELTFPGSIEKLGQEIFHNCGSLKRIRIPEGTREKFVSLLEEDEENGGFASRLTDGVTKAMKKVVLKIMNPDSMKSSRFYAIEDDEEALGLVEQFNDGEDVGKQLLNCLKDAAFESDSERREMDLLPLDEKLYIRVEEFDDEDEVLYEDKVYEYENLHEYICENDDEDYEERPWVLNCPKNMKDRDKDFLQHILENDCEGEEDERLQYVGCFSAAEYEGSILWWRTSWYGAGTMRYVIELPEDEDFDIDKLHLAYAGDYYTLNHVIYDGKIYYGESEYEWTEGVTHSALKPLDNELCEITVGDD